MDTVALIHGLLLFLGFIAFVSLHEFAHAWTAVRCGDDTPRLQGRVTLDPIAHIDLVGTIVLPLIMIVMGAMSGQLMLLGWGKPVQVNLSNFRRRRVDDILVSGAGPAMNVLIAIVLLGLMKIIQTTSGTSHLDTLLYLARLSMFLCFFNLLPIPPLDGGHIMRNLVGMSDEAYQLMSQYSFLFFIIIMRTPAIGEFVSGMTDSALALCALPFGWQLQ
jgi:Zn-dependent protease